MDLIRRGAERLMDRIRRRCQESDANLLVVTCRELIVALRFRLRGVPIGEKRQILAHLSHDGSEPAHELDCLPGEMVIIRNVNPASGVKSHSFRWEKLISPSRPGRSDQDWRHFQVRRFSQAALMDPQLWG